MSSQPVHNGSIHTSNYELNRGLIPDYETRIEDLMSLLVLINDITSDDPYDYSDYSSRDLFACKEGIVNIIQQYKQMLFENTPRQINFRYRTAYPLQNDAWRGLHLFRKIFGLISYSVIICRSFDENLMQILYHRHLRACDAASLDPRQATLFIFSLASIGSPTPPPPPTAGLDEVDRAVKKDADANSDEIAVNNTGTSADADGKPSSTLPVHFSLSTSPQFRNTFVIRASSIHDCRWQVVAAISEQMRDYLENLFCVLEDLRTQHIIPRFGEADQALPGSATDLSQYSKLITCPIDQPNGEWNEWSVTRYLKKRSSGRIKKHVGEYCLLAGLPHMAIEKLQASCEALKSVKDTLWTAAVEEILCGAYFLVMSQSDPNISGMLQSPSSSSSANSVHMNHSTANQASSKLVVTRARAAQRSATLINAFQCTAEGSAGGGGISVGGGIAAGNTSLSSSIVMSSLNNSNNNSTEHHVTMRYGNARNVLTFQQLMLRLEEAELKYQTIPYAQALQLECLLRMIRLALGQHQIFDVHDYIRRATFVLPCAGQLPPALESGGVVGPVVPVVDDQYDQMLRFRTLANAYDQLGFVRQAAFYRLLCADRCISAGVIASDASGGGSSSSVEGKERAYKLIVSSLPAYNLRLVSSDPRGNDLRAGWPRIQAVTLLKLCTSARHHSNLFLHHLSLVLNYMNQYLTDAEKHNIALRIRDLVRTNGAPQKSLRLWNGSVLAPVQFSRLPLVESFALNELPPRLVPVKRTKTRSGSLVPSGGGGGIGSSEHQQQHGIFIHNALRGGGAVIRHGATGSTASSATNRPGATSTRASFSWVVDEDCDVTLRVRNLLGEELSVENMALLTDGVGFKPLVSAFKLAASVPPTAYVDIRLSGRPREAGILRLLGYRMQVFGCRADCRFDRLAHIALNNTQNDAEKNSMPASEIEVVPPLPQIEVSSSLSAVDPLTFNRTTVTVESETSAVVGSSSVLGFAKLYRGEQLIFELQMQNVSRAVPVESLAVRCVAMRPHKDHVKLSALFPSVVLQPPPINAENNKTEGSLPIEPASSLNVQCTLQAAFSLLSARACAASVVAGSNNENTSAVPAKSTAESSSSKLMTPRTPHFGGLQLPTPLLRRGAKKFFSDTPHPEAHTVSSGDKQHDLGQDADDIGPNGRAEQFDIVLELTYSGGEGQRASYVRKQELIVRLDVQPILVVQKWDVLESDDPHECFLVLDVHSCLEDDDLELSCSHSTTSAAEPGRISSTTKHLVVQPNDTCRLPVPMPKFLHYSYSQYVTGQQHTNALSLYGRAQQYGERAMLHACQEHVAKNVLLKWALPSSATSSPPNKNLSASSVTRWGRCTLHDIVWTPKQVEMMLMPPVTWQVWLNDRQLTRGVHEITVEPGAQVQLGLILRAAIYAGSDIHQHSQQPAAVDDWLASVVCLACTEDGEIVPSLDDEAFCFCALSDGGGGSNSLVSGPTNSPLKIEPGQQYELQYQVQVASHGFHKLLIYMQHFKKVWKSPEVVLIRCR